MSKFVSLRLDEGQVERLRRAARQFGHTPTETAALLLEESLRQQEYAFIEFRGSPAGRQAYIKATRLAVWQVAHMAREIGDDAARVAADLEIPLAAIAAALAYAQAYPDEIEAAIEDHDDKAAHLARLIPNLEVMPVDVSAP